MMFIKLIYCDHHPKIAEKTIGVDSLNTRVQFEQVKNQIIDSMLLIGLCTGSFAFLLAYYPFDISRQGLPFYNDITAIIFLSLIYGLRKKIKIEVKAIVVIIVIFALIITDIMVWGLYSMNKAMIVIIPFYALFVFRFKAAIVIYFLAISIYLCIGYFNWYEPHQPSFFMARLNSFSDWIEGGVILTTVALVIVIFTKQYNNQLSTLIQNLESKNAELLDREKQLAHQNRNLNNTLNELRVNNEKLSEYAFINSHLLRAPLARMLSLANLLAKNLESEEKNAFIKSFMESANELDSVVTQINQTLERQHTDKKGDSR